MTSYPIMKWVRGKNRGPFTKYGLTQNRSIQTYTILLCNDDIGSVVEPTSSLVWADVILADFQRLYLVIYKILPHIFPVQLK